MRDLTQRRSRHVLWMSSKISLNSPKKLRSSPFSSSPSTVLILLGIYWASYENAAIQNYMSTIYIRYCTTLHVISYNLHTCLYHTHISVSWSRHQMFSHLVLSSEYPNIHSKTHSQLSSFLTVAVIEIGQFQCVPGLQNRRYD